MSMPLDELQRLFQARMRAGTPGIEPHLKDGGPFMGVYDHAYGARLAEVLGEDFEALHTLLGDDQFAAAVAAYIRDHPPSARSIRWAGKHLAAWLRATPPWSSMPVAADMAAFEWMLGLAFDAPDAAPIGTGALAGVPPEAWPMLVFTFHPALNAVVLNHDVAPFQAAVAADRAPDEAPAPFPAPVTWAAWRDPESAIVRHRALDLDEAAMLAAARAGRTFDALCEIVADHTDADDAALRTAALLRHWIDGGWIIGLDAEGLSW